MAVGQWGPSSLAHRADRVNAQVLGPLSGSAYDARTWPLSRFRMERSSGTPVFGNATPLRTGAAVFNP
jgi:hypothetical protein